MADRFSRRYTLLAMTILYAAGAILTAISFSLVSFIAFQTITGIAVGTSSLVVPMYIAEMSPVRIRGGLVILQQLAISGGILISYVLDYAFDSGMGLAGQLASEPPFVAATLTFRRPFRASFPEAAGQVSTEPGMRVWPRREAEGS